MNTLSSCSSQSVSASCWVLETVLFMWSRKVEEKKKVDQKAVKTRRLCWNIESECLSQVKEMIMVSVNQHINKLRLDKFSMER